MNYGWWQLNPKLASYNSENEREHEEHKGAALRTVDPRQWWRLLKQGYGSGLVQTCLHKLRSRLWVESCLLKFLLNILLGERTVTQRICSSTNLFVRYCVFPFLNLKNSWNLRIRIWRNLNHLLLLFKNACTRRSSAGVTVSDRRWMLPNPAVISTIRVLRKRLTLPVNVLR